MAEPEKLKSSFTSLLTLLVLALCHFALASCGNGQDERGLSPWATELLERIPDGDYSMLGYADIEAFAESDFGKLLLKFFPTYEEWSEKLGFKIEDLGRLAFAAYPPESEGEYGAVLMILIGDVSEENVLNLPAFKELQFELNEQGEYRVYTAKEDFGFCFVDTETLFLGSKELLYKALELEGGKGESLADGEGLAEFNKFFLKSDDFLVAVTGIDRIIRRLSDKYPYLKRFETFKAGVVGVEVDRDAGLRIVATCDKVRNAERIANGLQGLVGLLTWMAENEPYTNVDQDLVKVDIDELRRLVVQMLESVEAVNEEEDVIIRVVIPYDIINFITSVTHEVVYSERESGNN